MSQANSNYELAARELLRAIRGRRSQRNFARRLGYKANPITDWERGSRHPTAREALRAARSVKLPVQAAFERLSPIHPPRAEGLDYHLHEWLRAFCRERSILQLADTLQVSRYTLGRWLSGKAHPKLHEFLRLIDCVSGRVHDWVAALVPIESVPALLPAFLRARAARSIAFEQPWTEAILRVLETETYRDNPKLVSSALATCLGMHDDELTRALDGLVSAGVLELSSTGYVAVRELTVDTRVDRNELARLHEHWLGVALERTRRREQRDWFAYNVISLSRDDLLRVEEILRGAFRETRAVVAQSRPTEAAALVLMQLVRWPVSP